MKLFSSIFGCIFVALAMNAGGANASCSGQRAPDDDRPACDARWDQSTCENWSCDWSPDNDSIYLKNDCNQHGPIYVAINYSNSNLSDWKTEGFWELEYGHPAGPFPTTNTKFYVHAHAKNDDFIWKGNWGPWQLYGRDYKFSEATITTTSWGDWTQRFTCE